MSKFKTHTINLKDIKVISDDNVFYLEFPDKSIKSTSDRFFTSLAIHTGINKNITKHFSFDEVFSKHSDKFGPIKITENIDNKQCLAVVKLDTNICNYEDAMCVLNKTHGQNIIYHNGIVYSVHDINATQCLIDGENYTPKLFVEIPIDGYGKIYTHFSMHRMASDTLIIGYSQLFKNQILRSKNDTKISDTLQRVLDSYSNDEALDIFIKRLKEAKASTLSIKEYTQILNIISNTDDFIIQKFKNLVGNINDKYGIANLDLLNDKKGRLLPTECRVSDAINFLAELFKVSKIDISMKLDLQHFIGKLISSEYDLENISCEITNKIFYIG